MGNYILPRVPEASRLQDTETAQNGDGAAACTLLCPIKAAVLRRPPQKLSGDGLCYLASWILAIVKKGPKLVWGCCNTSKNHAESNGPGSPHSSVVTDELSRAPGHFIFVPSSFINNINMHFITALLSSQHQSFCLDYFYIIFSDVHRN